MLEAIVYIVFCALTGLCGIDRRIGFFGTFLLALVTTPFVVLPVLLLTGPSRRAEWQRRNRLKWSITFGARVTQWAGDGILWLCKRKTSHLCPSFSLFAAKCTARCRSCCSCPDWEALAPPRSSLPLIQACK